MKRLYIRNAQIIGYKYDTYASTFKIWLIYKY